MRRLVLSMTVACIVGCASHVDSETGASSQPILSGADDDTDTHVVALFRAQDGASDPVFCSGTLIARNLVLTAAYCVADIIVSSNAFQCEDVSGTPADRLGAVAAPGRFTIATGTDAYSTTAPKFSVAEVRMLPTAGQLPNCGQDIALLVLDESVPTSVAKSIPLHFTTPTKGDLFTAIGYGNDGAALDGTRRIRSGIKVTVVGEQRASGHLRATVNDFVVDEGPCGGDSGSPAVDAEGGVFGIFSRGPKTVCQNAIYTQVAPFEDWLRTEGVRAAKLGGYVPPTWAQPDAPPSPGASSSSSCAMSPWKGDGSAWLAIAFVGLTLTRNRRRR